MSAVIDTRTLARRVSPSATLRNTLTLAWRNLVQIRHNPLQLIELSIQPIMFTLLFAFVFGPAIGGSVHAYLPILIPGIIVQNSLFASLTTGVGLSADLSTGVFDRFRSLPISRSAPLAGRIAADVVKQAWSMAILVIVGVVLGFRVGTTWWSLVPVFGILLAFSLLFSWAAVYIGLTMGEPEKVQTLGMSVILPLTFLSNVFIPLSSKYPEWLRDVMSANPVSQLVDAFRGLLIGHNVQGAAQPVLQPTLNGLLWGLGIAAVFAPLSLRAFRKHI